MANDVRTCANCGAEERPDICQAWLAVTLADTGTVERYCSQACFDQHQTVRVADVLAGPDSNGHGARPGVTP